MEFRLLGPVELWVDGRQHKLGTAKERCVLASLLLSAGEPVSAETLIDRLWDDNPPAKPRQSLYAYVARLRHRLAQIGDVEVSSWSGGYRLRVDDEAVDLFRLRQLRVRARAVADRGDDETALALQRVAARMCRTEPLVDLPGDWAARTRRVLADELLAATLERVEIELRLGHHADLIDELSNLVARYPFNEELTEQLMVALFRCGRQTEALQVYRDARDRLVDELGTEAGLGLRKLHQRILNGDLALLYAPRPCLETVQQPNTLPRDIPAFTGRREEIEQLQHVLMRSQAQERGSAVNAIAIDGMPGVGKTALAIHVAHSIAGRYPDGQLYLSLHAHDQRDPVDPATALEILLRGLGIPVGRIPSRLDDRARLWRAQLANSQTLIVLDDATEGEQVRPLLPRAPGCLVIITSRLRLTGLDDVYVQSLDVLPAEQAAALFTSIVGSVYRADDDDVAALVRHCGYLPLAIQIVASKLRHRPTWSIADLLSYLANDNRRLAELRAENRGITAIFEMSYRGLSPQQKRAFRSCGQHPGPDFTAHAAAAILQCTTVEAEQILKGLADYRLISEPVHGRYRFDGLLDAYARGLARTKGSGSQRRRDLHRALDYYLSTADRADRLLYPHRYRADTPVVYPPQDPPSLESEAQARDWLDAELDNLLTAARYAARQGWHSQVAHLAHILAQHLQSRGHWEAAVRLHRHAVAAWREIGDQARLGDALFDLSTARWRTGRFDRALDAAEEALVIRRSLGDRRGEADLLDHIALIYWRRSEPEDALRHFQGAHAIRRDIGDQRGAALVLNHIALVLFHRGQYKQAYNRLRDALEIHRTLDDRRGQTIVLNNIGEIEFRLGHYDAALSCYEEAAEASEISHQSKAILQNNMGKVLEHTDRYSEALVYYRQALETFQQIGDLKCQAGVLIDIGSTFQCMDRNAEALIHHQKALTITREISEQNEEVRALRHIGEVHAQAKRYKAALDHYGRALQLAVQINDPYQQARALDRIGTTLLHTQNRSQALHHWQNALRLYEQLGAPTWYGDRRGTENQLWIWDGVAAAS